MLISTTRTTGIVISMKFSSMKSIYIMIEVSHKMYFFAKQVVVLRCWCHDIITWINLNIVQQRSAGGQHDDQTINSILLLLPVVSSFLVNTETWKPRSPIFGASGGNNKIK